MRINRLRCAELAFLQLGETQWHEAAAEDQICDYLKRAGVSLSF